MTRSDSTVFVTRLWLDQVMTLTLTRLEKILDDSDSKGLWFWLDKNDSGTWLAENLTTYEYVLLCNLIVCLASATRCFAIAILFGWNILQTGYSSIKKTHMAGWELVIKLHSSCIGIYLQHQMNALHSYERICPTIHFIQYS